MLSGHVSTICSIPELLDSLSIYQETINTVYGPKIDSFKENKMCQFWVHILYVFEKLDYIAVELFK